MPAIHWFRRDLRVGDNPALEAAGSDAVGVFVRDPALRVGAVRARYLDDALEELARSRRVEIHTGDPADVLADLAETHGARPGLLHRGHDTAGQASGRPRGACPCATRGYSA